MSSPKQNLERQFWINTLSRYLDVHPEEAKELALDFCDKYLEQEQKVNRLEQHCRLLEEKIDEMQIDYQILQMELQRYQRQSIATTHPGRKSTQLSWFLFGSKIGKQP